MWHQSSRDDAFELAAIDAVILPIVHLGSPNFRQVYSVNLSAVAVRCNRAVR